MIRKVLICTAAVLSLSSAAFAADLPSTRAPIAPPPIPVFTWTGLYIGGQIGYGFGNDSGLRGFAPLHAKPDGVFGGAHVGYNVQLPSSNFVIGLEGDVNGSGYKGTEPTIGYFTTKIPVDGSIRGRVGFAVDRALFYATGGVAFASIKNAYVTGDSISSTRTGYTIGGGVEYSITNEWSVRGEYRYQSFGAYSDLLSPFRSINFSNKETESKVLAGFSYHFPIFAAPVVARY